MYTCTHARTRVRARTQTHNRFWQQQKNKDDRWVASLPLLTSCKRGLRSMQLKRSCSLPECRRLREPANSGKKHSTAITIVILCNVIDSAEEEKEEGDEEEKEEEDEEEKEEGMQSSH